MLKNKTIGFLLIIGLLTLTWHYQAIAASGLLLSSLEHKELLQVKVQRLIMDPTSKQPVVILSDSSEERALLIWISFFEANAIYRELQDIESPRPQTHDLLESVIQKVSGKINRIIITSVKDDIYYATIVLEKDESFLEIDARPSDSIVMALKFKAPIFVSKPLFAKMAISIGEQKGIQESYGLSLQNLTSELAKAFSFESTRGVLVSDVREGSRAEQDGLERGDIFVEVEGRAVDEVIILKDALAKSEKAVNAKIYRNAHFLTLTLHLK